MTSAIILAGGLGTRLRSVVSDRPKPMALVQDQPFLQRLMDYWITQGIDAFILSVGYKASSISDYFGDAYQGIPIKYAVENEPLGTGGGLILAMQMLSNNSPFLLLNGDTFFAINLKELINFHNEHHSECTFSLFRANEPNRYMGIDVSGQGQITCLRSERGQVGDLANGGVYLINPLTIQQNYSLLSGKKISLEDDIFYQLLNDKCAIFGLESTAKFIDIGIPHDYTRAAEVMDLR